jgi:hypothetical protein
MSTEVAKIDLSPEYDEIESDFVGALCDYDFKAGSCVARLMKPKGIEDFNSACDDLDDHLLNKMAHGVDLIEIDGGWVHSDGVSAKTMTLYPLSMVTGKEHLVETINTVASGSIVVFTHEGPVMLRAGDCFTSAPGVRKVGITLTGVTFVNSFPNPDNVRNEEDLDEMFFREPPALLKDRSGAYSLFLEMSGLNEETVQAFMDKNPSHESSADESFAVLKSKISGNGLFSKRAMKSGESFPLIENENRTIIARYCNHSFEPDMVAHGDKAILLRDINEGEEVTMNYYDNFIKTSGRGVKCLLS